MSTPANGPISEYGRYKTVKAAAAAVGFGNVLALKNTYVPTPAVTMPSPACEISRVANRRRNPRSASTVRRSATKAERAIRRHGPPRPETGQVWRSGGRDTLLSLRRGQGAGRDRQGQPPRGPRGGAGPAGRAGSGRDPGQRSTSPRMNLSTASRATSSPYCSGGDFMKYDAADRIGPPIPRSRAILAARTASMITPAELGASQTSSRYSRFR